MSDGDERIAFFNGEYLPESQVRIPFRDRGFIMGDAVFDSARTFGGRPFRLEQHVDRLYDSMAYLRIDPRIERQQMLAISERVLEANRHLLPRDVDYWITQRVSRGGVARGGDDQTRDDRPTVIVECQPLPLRKRARLFVDGIPVVVPSVRRTPPWALSPRAKTQNYLNLVVADLEARAHDPDAWAVLLDGDGNLAEGLGSNIFLVDRDNRLLTPRASKVLPGITRAAVFELAHSQGITIIEGDFDLYDATIAAEAFLTSTSLCICPVSRINERRFDGAVPGPVTTRLMQAFRELVRFDYVAQYRAHL